MFKTNPKAVIAKPRAPVAIGVTTAPVFGNLPPLLLFVSGLFVSPGFPSFPGLLPSSGLFSSFPGLFSSSGASTFIILIYFPMLY